MITDRNIVYNSDNLILQFHSIRKCTVIVIPQRYTTIRSVGIDKREVHIK